MNKKYTIQRNNRRGINYISLTDSEDFNNVYVEYQDDVADPRTLVHALLGFAVRLYGFMPDEIHIEENLAAETQLN